MIKRLLLLLKTKLKSVFLQSLSFSSRIEYSNVSKKAKVWGHCKLFYSTIGDFSYVGRNTRIVHADIGKFCSIAGGVIVGMGTHTIDKISTSPIFTEKDNSTKHSWVDTSIVNPYKRVKVGNDVWIGERAIVMGGVTIEDGAVIGAGAIVTKNVPPYAVVAGVPAKLLYYRFPQDQIKLLLRHPWWEIPEQELKEHIQIFQTSKNVEKMINDLCHVQNK